MAAMLLTWAVAAVVIVGWGLLAQRALGVRACRLDDLLRAFWLGVVMWIAYLQVVHFVMPVGVLSLCVGVGIGINGWLLSGRRPVLGVLATVRRHRVPAALAGLAALFVAGHALGSAAMYDAGLYHLQAVRWNQAFAIVPGLGNLHSRLAFNNASFLLQAQALLGPWRSAGFGIVNGLLALAVTAQATLSLARIMKRRSDSYLADSIGALLLLPVLVTVLRSFSPAYSLFVSTLSPDVTAIMLQLAALAYAARLLSRPADRRTLELLVLSTSLLTAAACVKTSSGPFALALFLILTGAAARRGHVWWRPVLLTAGCSCLLVGPWVLRGVVLSGYPLFPIDLGAMNVAWRLPAEAAETMRDAVGSWSRTWGRPYTPGAPWVGPWLHRSVMRDIAMFCLPVGLAVVAAVTALVRARIGSPCERRTMVALLLPISVGLATWWLTAPDPRFGFAALYALAICLAAWVVSRTHNPAIIGRRVALTLIVGMAVVVAVRVHHRRGVPLPEALARVILPTPSSPRGYSVLPDAPVQARATDSGLVIHFPLHLDLAWDAPLPSAPAPTTLGLDLRYLSLRRAGDPGAGFVMVPPSTAVSAAP